MIYNDGGDIMKMSFIVPCYNEEGNIKAFYQKMIETIDYQKNSYEIICINDGSKDKTLQVLKELLDKEIPIKIIDFSRNFGKEAGIYAGLKEATGDYIAIIDADLQQNPKFLLKMKEILDTTDYDIVTSYQKKRKEGLFLSFFKKLFYKLINRLSEVEFVSGASDFRMFRKNVKDAILELNEYYRFSKGIFSFVGFDTYYMPYDVESRNSGKTKWSFWKLFKYAIDGIVSFTTAPLRLATILGLLISLGSFIYLVILIIQKLYFGIKVAGYASLLGVSLLIGGIQLLSLGIIGEYLARTYIEVKKRPVYITKKIYKNK